MVSAGSAANQRADHGSDLELMHKAGEGDRAARRTVAKRLMPVAKRVAHALLRASADADDAVQLSLIEVLRSAGTYRGETAVERWAQRIVVRTTLRHIREQRRYYKVVDGDAEVAEAGPELLQSVPEATDALARPLRFYLSKLSEVQRDAVVLRHAFGYSVAEIAELTGVSENTAKARLLYGRRALRKLVRRDLNIGVSGAGTPEGSET